MAVMTLMCLLSILSSRLYSRCLASGSSRWQQSTRTAKTIQSDIDIISLTVPAYSPLHPSDRFMTSSPGSDPPARANPPLGTRHVRSPLRQTDLRRLCWSNRLEANSAAPRQHETKPGPHASCARERPARTHAKIAGGTDELLGNVCFEHRLPAQLTVYSNVFIERFWKTLKYAEVYLRAYDTVSEARASIACYIEFYKYVSYCPISLYG